MLGSIRRIIAEAAPTEAPRPEPRRTPKPFDTWRAEDWLDEDMDLAALAEELLDGAPTAPEPPTAAAHDQWNALESLLATAADTIGRPDAADGLTLPSEAGPANALAAPAHRPEPRDPRTKAEAAGHGSEQDLDSPPTLPTFEVLGSSSDAPSPEAAGAASPAEVAALGLNAAEETLVPRPPRRPLNPFGAAPGITVAPPLEASPAPRPSPQPAPPATAAEPQPDASAQPDSDAAGSTDDPDAVAAEPALPPLAAPEPAPEPEPAALTEAPTAAAPAPTAPSAEAQGAENQGAENQDTEIQGATLESVQPPDGEPQSTGSAGAAVEDAETPLTASAVAPARPWENRNVDPRNGPGAKEKRTLEQIRQAVEKKVRQRSAAAKRTGPKPQREASDVITEKVGRTYTPVIERPGRAAEPPSEAPAAAPPTGAQRAVDRALQEMRDDAIPPEAARAVGAAPPETKTALKSASQTSDAGEQAALSEALQIAGDAAARSADAAAPPEALKQALQHWLEANLAKVLAQAVDEEFVRRQTAPQPTPPQSKEADKEGSED